MKKVILFFTGLGLSLLGFSQVTVDPNTAVIAANTGQTVTEIYHLKQIMENMKDIAEKAKELEKNVEFLRGLKNVKRTINLIDELICNSRKLEIYLGFSSLYNSCIGNVNVRMTLVNLQASFDLINLVLSSGITMSQGERIKTWNDALDRLEKAQKEIAKLNLQIRGALEDDIQTEYRVQQIKTYNSISRY